MTIQYGPVQSRSLSDIFLFVSGLALALGSAAFAGIMLLETDHAPRINGIEYLAIFAKPNGSTRVAASPERAEPAVAAAAPSVDFAPTGSIAPEPLRPQQANRYVLESARADIAVLKSGPRILVVKPGVEIPELGRVGSIVNREGAWMVLNARGEVLVAEQSAPLSTSPPPDRFARRLIFGAAPAVR